MGMGWRGGLHAKGKRQRGFWLEWGHCSQRQEAQEGCDVFPVWGSMASRVWWFKKMATGTVTTPHRQARPGSLSS